MTQAKLRFASFEEYLAYSNEAEMAGRFVLMDGALTELPPGSPENDFIAQELFWLLAIAQLVPRQLIRPHTLELQVPVLHPTDPANRYPDLVILRPEHLTLMERRLTITLEMPPPQLIVEVVSPGPANRDRDYLYKRAQYAAIGVPEYWIINPPSKTVMVLQLQDAAYAEVGMFGDHDAIVSPTFSQLQLTVDQVFGAG